MPILGCAQASIPEDHKNVEAVEVTFKLDADRIVNGTFRRNLIIYATKHNMMVRTGISGEDAYTIDKEGQCNDEKHYVDDIIRRLRVEKYQVSIISCRQN